MKSESTQEHPITRWLQTTNGLWFSLYTASSAFCLYTCIFALRKTFGVATYENMSLGGVDFKVWMVIFQVLGYMLSKFIGIKVVSELGAHARLKGILLMVSIACLSWLLFAITPRPYNLVFLFFNGLPLNQYYYIVIRTRHALETWSKLPVLFDTGALGFDFTTP